MALQLGGAAIALMTSIALAAAHQPSREVELGLGLRDYNPTLGKKPSLSRQYKDMLQTASRAGVGKPQMQTRAQTRAQAQIQRTKNATEQLNIRSKLAREKALQEELRQKEEKVAQRRMYAKQGIDLRMNTLPGAKKPTTGDVEFTKKSKTLPPSRRTNVTTVGRGTRAQKARFAQRMVNYKQKRQYKKVPKSGKIKKRSKYKKGKKSYYKK